MKRALSHAGPGPDTRTPAAILSNDVHVASAPTTGDGAASRSADPVRSSQHAAASNLFPAPGSQCSPPAGAAGRHVSAPRAPRPVSLRLSRWYIISSLGSTRLSDSRARPEAAADAVHARPRRRLRQAVAAHRRPICRCHARARVDQLPPRFHSRWRSSASLSEPEPCTHYRRQAARGAPSVAWRSGPAARTRAD